MSAADYTTEDFKKWGAEGGKARKMPRKLTREQSLAMLKARAAKRRKAKKTRSTL